MAGALGKALDTWRDCPGPLPRLGARRRHAVAGDVVAVEHGRRRLDAHDHDRQGRLQIFLMPGAMLLNLPARNGTHPKSATNYGVGWRMVDFMDFVGFSLTFNKIRCHAAPRGRRSSGSWISMRRSYRSRVPALGSDYTGATL